MILPSTLHRVVPAAFRRGAAKNIALCLRFLRAALAPRRLRFGVVLGLTFALLLPVSVRPAYAYDYDTHYLWTYYLALQAGFTERQAFQIGSAAFAIDDDPDTGPLHAKAMDSLFGLETDLFRSQEVNGATRDLAIDGRELLTRVHQVIVSGLQNLGDNWGPLAEVANRFEEMLENLPNDSFLYGSSFRHWREVDRVVIRNVWSNFHAFARSELLPAAIGAAQGTREERVDVYIGQILWNFMPLWVYLDPTNFPPELLDARPGKIQILTEDAMAARDGEANLLWRMALAERNPGPLIHFTQDSFSHGEFDNIRGHANWGHKPDFLSYDPAKSQRMTIATLHTLCRFRDAVVPASLRDSEGAPGYERAELCDFLFSWLEHDPADPITFYTERMDVQALIAGRTGGPSVRGGAGADVGSRDFNPVLNRVFDVLDLMIAVNPLPEHIGNWDPGMLPSEWFSSLSRGVVNRPAALNTIQQAIAEDMQAGRIPSLKTGNLEEKWGYPPSAMEIGPGAGVSLGQDKGLVWPRWAVPEHFREFDYDSAGSVLLHDPENYLGSSTYLARVENMGAAADRFEEDYPVELPRVAFTEDVEVRFERRAAAPADGLSAAAEAADEIDVFVTFAYEVQGIKEISAVSWVGETVYYDGEWIRAAELTGEQTEESIPLPVIEACTFEGYPYEPIRGEDRRAPNNKWGFDGTGDDWGTRVLPRDIAQPAPNVACRSCVETELHFRIPRSLVSAGSLEGICSVHLYGHAPWEKKFQVPVAMVSVGRVKRGGRE